MRFDDLREALLKGGVAPRHVRRYLRELDDHLADLTQAQQALGYDRDEAMLRAQALLGGDQELARAMLARPQFKSLTARVPWLVFGLAPPAAIIAAFFAAIVPLELIRAAIGRDHISAPHWYQDLAHATAYLVNLGVGPGLAVLLAWVAWRQRLNRLWPLLAVLLLALTAMHMMVYFPPDGHRGGSISIGPALLTTARARPALRAQWPLLMAQTLVTLAPAIWIMRRWRVHRA